MKLPILAITVGAVAALVGAAAVAQDQSAATAPEATMQPIPNPPSPAKGGTRAGKSAQHKKSYTYEKRGIPTAPPPPAKAPSSK